MDYYINRYGVLYLYNCNFALFGADTINRGEREMKSWDELLTAEQRERIIISAGRVSFRQGETIIKQGTSASAIYLLDKGMVKLVSEEDDRMTVFKIMGDGSFIGLMCSFAGHTFDFSAIAINPCEVLIIDRSLFEQAIRENGDFAMHIVGLMSEMTAKIVNDLIGLSHKQADGAVSTILLELADIFGSNSFRMPFTRAVLADTIGYSTESAINTLASLHKSGIIKVSGKSIEILDAKRLSLIARHG